ncbi:YraN family protein [Marinibaculum pumilum]|uniref:UPF0102 protein ACFOGJ_22185 n=1 Tax=Marinibaculum pumilum TaxID=1766165 RepID=A0ABV7L5M7_9PROT
MTANERSARQRRWRDGRRAEALAVLWLRLKGYRVLARNWRHAGGEVDIIARRGGVIVAVEVKRRADESRLAEALEGLARGQQRRIARAAMAFVQRHAARASGDRAAAVPALRFDLIVVRGCRLRHLRDVWRLDD